MKNGLNHMVNRGIFVLYVVLLLVLLSSNVFAITANIGNARMVLRANVGDTIEKSILVKNINNDSIVINMTVSGDNEKDIKIIDNNFILSSGQEKEAKFTIKVTKSGTFEDKINVYFFSPSENKGVGLSSNIVLIVNGSEEDNSTYVEPSEENPDVTDPDNPSDIKITNLDPVKILFIITGIILLVFFIVLIIYYIKSRKQIEKNEINNNNNNTLENSKLKESDERKVKKIKSKKSAKKHV